MWLAFYRVYRENTFGVPAVRMQKERGHTVISTGPYAVVRHPLYTCSLIFLPAIALLLGSRFGLLGALLLDALFIYRTHLEDRLLLRNLDGYTDYASRVRYRLIPHVW